jgi:C1A family cysteine protease
MSAGSNGGWVPLPEPGETLEGGHCVLSHGYDQALTWQKITGWITDRNSWGDAWGDKGNFRIPIAYYQNPQFASDFWEISVTG